MGRDWVVLVAATRIVGVEGELILQSPQVRARANSVCGDEQDPTCCSGHAQADRADGLDTTARERGLRAQRLLDQPVREPAGWRWRFRARAPVLAAGFGSLAVALSAAALTASPDPEVAALEALAGAWEQARRRFGAPVRGPFDFASAVSGGALLAILPPSASSGRVFGPSGDGRMTYNT